jgi:hypothetical protein
MCWNEAVCHHIKAFKPTLENAGGKVEDVKNWCISCWNSTHPTNLYDRDTFHIHKEGTTNTRARAHGVNVVKRGESAPPSETAAVGEARAEKKVAPAPAQVPSAGNVPEPPMASKDIYLCPIGNDRGLSNFENTIWNRCDPTSTTAPVWDIYPTKPFLSSVERNGAWVLYKASNKGDYIALAWVDAVTKRELGPLVAVSETDEERGWEQRPSARNKHDVTFKAVWDLRADNPGAWNSPWFKHAGLADAHTIPIANPFPLNPEKAPEAYAGVLNQITLILTYLTPTWKSASFEAARAAALIPL